MPRLARSHLPCLTTPAQSKSLGGLDTNVNVFIPEGSGPFPVLYYLAGLTCNEDTGCASPLRSFAPLP
jgi:hypothetical protein